jgi:hypothetical protein
MKKQFLGYKCIIAVLLGASVAFAATGREPATASNSPPAGAVKHSTGVDEILTMTQAGVSSEVLKTYVESSQIPYNLNATDLIDLKQHGVPDDLTMAMLKRGANLRTQAGQSSNLNSTSPAYPVSRSRHGLLDPESYNYFQYYYLYPRTLAAANQRLFSSYPTYLNTPLYPYSNYGPPPFYPAPPSVFGRP